MSDGWREQDGIHDRAAHTRRAERAGRWRGRSRAAGYDDFIDPVREALVKAWEAERDALKRAIQDDEARLRAATSAKDRERLARVIAQYKEKLAKHERNDPPYIDLNALKKK